MAYFSAVSWLAFGQFFLLVLLIALFGLALSGHLPLQARDAQDTSLFDRLTIVATVAIVALAAVRTIGLGLGALPGPIAIIGAGGALLLAPLLLRALPDSFVDGRRGLIVLAALTASLAYLPGGTAG